MERLLLYGWCCCREVTVIGGRHCCREVTVIGGVAVITHSLLLGGCCYWEVAFQEVNKGEIFTSCDQNIACCREVADVTRWQFWRFWNIF